MPSLNLKSLVVVLTTFRSVTVLAQIIPYGSSVIEPATLVHAKSKPKKAPQKKREPI
ncbi:MAG: hypothetical protein JXR76_03810 [Deltaproteobacteria bacterium]|nr:hypothetical protein [Deltaproteobacteria bacterium]